MLQSGNERKQYERVLYPVQLGNDGGDHRAFDCVASYNETRLLSDVQVGQKFAELRCLVKDMGAWPSGRRRETVNLFGKTRNGSNPLAPTKPCKDTE